MVRCLVLAVLVSCGWEARTVGSCLPSDHPDVGVQGGCPELVVCSEVDFKVNDDNIIRHVGRPKTWMEWDGGDGYEKCRDRWDELCTDQLQELANEVCP